MHQLFFLLRPMEPGDPSYHKILGNGEYLLRWSTIDDRDRLIAADAPRPFTFDGFWKESATDWALCFNTSQDEGGRAVGRIVGKLLVSRRVWTFEDASTLFVGQPWILEVDEEHRRRPPSQNIAKHLMEMFHERCRMRGDVFTAVEGVPAYYRKYHYEYAHAFQTGYRSTIGQVKAAFPKSGWSEAESEFILRPANPVDDVDRLWELHEAPRSQSAIWVSSPKLQLGMRGWLGLWPSEIQNYIKPFRTDQTTSFWVLENRANFVVGALRFDGAPDTHSTVSRILFDDTIGQSEEIIKQIVLQVFDKARAYGSLEEGETTLESLRWDLPPGHGAVQHLLKLGLMKQLPANDSPRQGPIWQVRVPHLPTFLRAIIPALNVRLARATQLRIPPFHSSDYDESSSSDTVELRMGTFVSSYEGAILTIEGSQRKVINVVGKTWAPVDFMGKFGTPTGLNFVADYGPLVRILFGYASWREAKAMWPDSGLADGLEATLGVLFPKSLQSSHAIY